MKSHGWSVLAVAFSGLALLRPVNPWMRGPGIRAEATPGGGVSLEVPVVLSEGAPLGSDAWLRLQLFPQQLGLELRFRL